MGIFAKLAYSAGLDVVTLLSLRFALAAALLWAIVRVRGIRSQRRPLLLGLALGAFGYALEAGLFFFSLERLEVGLASLVMYSYPAFVALGALALGRERLTPRRGLALLLASAGLVLVLGAGGDADGIALLLALGAGLGYAAYILGTDSVVRAVEPLPFAASVCTGSALSFLTVGAASGGLDLGFAADGWLWLVALAVLSTVVPIAAFASGVKKIGPSRSSILSTVEPPFTIALAMLVFGDALGVSQFLGGALVLAGAVLVVERSNASVSSARPWPFRSRRPSSPSSPSPPRRFRPATSSTSPSGTASAASPSSTVTRPTSSPATASR